MSRRTRGAWWDRRAQERQRYQVTPPAQTTLSVSLTAIAALAALCGGRAA